MTNNRSTRRIAMLLAAVLSVSAFASCGGSAAPSGDTTASGGTDTDTTAAPETELTDDVPDLDFKGAHLRTVQQTPGSYGFFAEEQTGEVVNDTIYARNSAVAERFNIVIDETIVENYQDVSSRVSASVLAGADDYDLVLSQIFRSGRDALSGLFYDWNSIKYIDLSKPWYNQSLNDAAVGGKLYMLESDLSISYIMQTWMMLYNKTKAKEYQSFPDLYQTVRDGKWTIDLLNSLSAEIYTDVNGDSTRDMGDFYGFAGISGGCLLAAYVYACDATLTELTKDMKMEHTISSEKTISVLEKISLLFSTGEGTYATTGAGRALRKTFFPTGNVMFMPAQVDDLCWPEMRSFKDEFGVLPMPKYDEKQKEYYTVVDGGADILTVPATAQNTDMIGAVVEALSALSYKEVLPAYINMALEQKGTRDEESIEMLRSILDSRVIDFSYLYDCSKGWVMKLPSIIANAESISSTIASNQSAMETYWNETITYLTEE